MKVAPPPPPVVSGEQAAIKGKITPPYYYSDHLRLYMFASYNKIEYKFIMKFSSPVLYRKVRKYIFNNRNKKIVVSGVWHDDGTHAFRTDITDAGQVVAE